MTYDNLFKDRATWGRPYRCQLNFIDAAGDPLDMTPVTSAQMDFKQSYADESPLFSLVLGDGLAWQNNDPTTGSLLIAITKARAELVSLAGDLVSGNEVPSTTLFADLEMTLTLKDVSYDEGTVPKLMITVEQEITPP